MKPNKFGKFARRNFVHLIALALFFVTLPGLLSAQTLLHRYSFVSDASDSVGGPTWNGTVVAPNGGSAVTIANGLVLPGGGGNNNGYVALPSGILTNTASLTIECWVTENVAQQWATIWDFANDGSHNFEMCPFPQRGINNLDVAITPHGNEIDTITHSRFPSNSEEYVAFTFDASALTGRIYTNGVQDAVQVYPDATYIPGTIGGANGTSQNWLGNDTYGDTQFQGTLYEFRIWNGVVSQRYLAASAIAGPGVLINNLTPTSISVTAGATVPVTGTEQADVTCQLPQTGTANLEATKDATNWVSSNPSVLTVSSNGVVTGISPGTATVSATIAGVSSTSGAITISSMGLIHRYSFASDASDSMGGPTWNGALVAPSTNGTAATINNGLTLPGGGGPGYSGYLTLPAGILTNTTSVTIEGWITQNNGNTWAQIFNFGNGQSQNMGLIPMPGRDNGNLEYGITPNGGEVDCVSSIHFPTNSEQYVSMVFNSSTLQGYLYDNGVLIASRTFPDRTYIPGSIGGVTGTTNNVLGQDPWPDPQFQGVIHELRIWNGVVSPVYEAVSAAAGPSVVVTNTTPQTLAVTVTNTSMIGAETQQATVTGSFLQATGVDVTGAATNWVSSNPTVLTVSSSGLITALSGGTATVSATVNGVTATSATIAVANTSPTFTKKPSDKTAAVGDTVTFSAQALGGGLTYQWSWYSTPIPGATNATLTLTNITTASGGTYNILVSNNLGTTNASATLTVYQAILEHRYSFVSDASDSVGGPAWTGTVVAPGNTNGSPATINNGLTLPGGGGPGYSGYVRLPAGILTNTTSLTVECWATQNSQQSWAELYSFNNGTPQYFAFIPYPANNNNNMSLAIRTGDNESDAFSSVQFPNASEQYIAATFDASSLVGRLYQNGGLIASVKAPNSSYIPGTYGGASGTANNILGQDPWPDPQFQGTIYEFRIWDGAVSPLYLKLSAVAGPSVVVTNLTPTSVTVTTTNATMIAGQSQQASVIGNFQYASGIDVTSAATNWVSSNSGVLTVNSNGLVTAVGTGNATVSATVNGVVGTSSTITVPTSAPVITQQPAASETLLVGATLRANVAVVGNPPFVYEWFFNGGPTPISVATNNPVLTIPNVQLGNAGSYTCVVTNQYGSSPSSSALNLAVVTPTPYQQSVLSYGPVGFWPLNETSGSTAYDVIGGNNGAYLGGYALGNPGPTNSFFSSSASAYFDGSSAYVDIPEGPLNITNAVTMVAWVELTAQPGFGNIIGHGDSSWRMTVSGNTGQPAANDGNAISTNNVFGDATAPTNIVLLDSAWHMVAYTYTGVTNQPYNGVLYMDGVPVAANTVLSVPGNNLDVWIGAAPDYGTGSSARFLPALIANVAVFDQALTGAQVQALYNGQFLPGKQYITVSHSGSNAVLSWKTGTLLQAPSITGPWTTNNAAVSPYTVPAASGNQFFKLLVSP